MPEPTKAEWEAALLVLKQVERAQCQRTWDTSESLAAKNTRHAAPIATALAAQREPQEVMAWLMVCSDGSPALHYSHFLKRGKHGPGDLEFVDTNNVCGLGPHRLVPLGEIYTSQKPQEGSTDV